MESLEDKAARLTAEIAAARALVVRLGAERDQTIVQLLQTMSIRATASAVGVSPWQVQEARSRLLGKGLPRSVRRQASASVVVGPVVKS